MQPASRDAEGMKDWAIGQLPLHGRPAQVSILQASGHSFSPFQFSNPILSFLFFLQPSEMGGAYVFLADSGSSNIMTGSVLHLSHGQWFGS